MPDSSPLVTNAREARIVVVGGGVAGAVAALECAKVGMTVTLLEADSRIGGEIGTVDLDGVAVDAVIDDFAADAPVLTALLDDLGLTGEVGPVAARSRWISGLPGAARLPDDAVVGIPANPWDPAVRRIIGWSGVWRAYLDRLRPPLTIGHQRNLGALVRGRMGDLVCDRMVAPVARGLFGVAPEEVDVETAAPGLGGALTRTGSLAGAVGAIGPSEPARAALAGGVAQVAQALAERLHLLGVDVRVGTRARGVHREAAEWRVAIDTADGDQELPADAVVLATDQDGVRTLLGEAAALPAAPAEHRVDVVTLRVRMPDVGRAEVYPLRGAAHRLVDVTVRSGHADALAQGERIVRVTLQASDAPDAAVYAVARDALADAYGVPVGEADLRASARVQRTEHSCPSRVLLEERRAVRHVAHQLPGLALTGAWLAGGGLAEIVADAAAESARLRRRVLWGEDVDETPRGGASDGAG